MVFAAQEDSGEVVALGTGDACLSSQKLQDDGTEEVSLAAEGLKLDDEAGCAQVRRPTEQPGGMILFDSHAEVVARRAFIKWVTKFEWSAVFAGCGSFLNNFFW
jgi:hypothetical protein